MVYRFVISILYLFALLPLPVLYSLSSGISFFVHRIIRYRRRVVRRNLQLCFPEKSKSELLRIESDFYAYLCDVFVESVKLLHISDNELRRRITLEGKELITEYAAEGKPIILFLAHYANWEWVPALTLDLDEPKNMGALYKPLRNHLMNRISLRLRSRFKSECIPVKTAYRRLVELRRETSSFMIGFIADQRALGVSLKHWTMFFGQPTSFYAGGETIGDRVNAKYVYLEMKRPKRGHYIMRFHPIIPDEDTLRNKDFPYTRTFFQMLQKTISEAPPFWLWSHNRWKKVRAEVIIEAQQNTATTKASE